MFKTKPRRGLYTTGWTTNGNSQGDLFCTVEEIERAGTRSHIKYLEFSTNKATAYKRNDFLSFLPDWVETDKIDWVGDRPSSNSTGDYIPLTDAKDEIDDAADFIHWHKGRDGGRSLAMVVERLVFPTDKRDGKWTREDLEHALREVLEDES